MTISFTTFLGFGKPDFHHPSWHTSLNIRADLIEEAIGGFATISLAGGDPFPTITNDVSSDARHHVIQCVGALGADTSITLPAVQKSWIIENKTTGDKVVNVIMVGNGAQHKLRQGQRVLIYCDGTELIEQARAPQNGAEIVIGTAAEVTDRLATHLFSSFVASARDTDRIVFLPGTHTLVSNITLSTAGKRDDLHISMLPGAILDLDNDGAGPFSFTLGGTRCVAQMRFTDGAANMVVVSGHRCELTAIGALKAWLNVTGNSVVRTTGDAAEIAFQSKLELGTGSILANGVVGTTQSGGDNTTKLSTTAYADAAAGSGVNTKAVGLLHDFGFTVVISGNDILVSIKLGDNSTNPSGGSPVFIAFNERQVALSLTAADSITLDQTDHLGLDFANPPAPSTGDPGGPDLVFRTIYLYAIDNAGTIEWGLGLRSDYTRKTAKFGDGLGSALDFGGVFTSAAIAANSNCRVVGFFKAKYDQTTSIWTAIEAESAVVFPMPIVHFDESSRVLLATITANGDSEVIFDNLITDEFEDYEVVLKNIQSVADNTGLLLRVSEDNGANWLAGTNYARSILSHSFAFNTQGNDNDSSFPIKIELGNAVTAGVEEEISGIIKLFQPGKDTIKHLTWHVALFNFVTNFNGALGVGGVKTTNPYNALQFFMITGNLARGTFELYGLRSSS